MNCCSDFFSCFFGARFFLESDCFWLDEDCVCGGELGVLVSTAVAGIGAAMVNPSNPPARMADKRNTALIISSGNGRRGALCRHPPRSSLTDPPDRTTTPACYSEPP